MSKRVWLALLCGLLLLSACDSSEERAEAHFQSALEYIENGDIDRAIVEFRNVFKLNGLHREARLTYARLQRDGGDVRAAYGQYLRVVEQYPDDLEGRRALAEMAAQSGNWEEAARHVRIASELAPDDPLIRSVNVLLSYRDAIQTRNNTAEQEAFEAARTLLVAHPDQMLAHQVVVDTLMRDGNWSAALNALDAAITTAPEQIALYRLRLSVLHQLGDIAAIEAQLVAMTERFPNDRSIAALRLNWYVSQGDLDAAEAYLRSQTAHGAEDPEAEIRLVRFLLETRGSEDALEQLNQIISGDTPNASIFRALRAGLVFDTGDHHAAITEMEGILESVPPSAETDNIKVALAQMQSVTGNTEVARTLVEEVLSSDSTHVEAMKLKAGWLIEDDKTGDAIVLLRAALGQSPRDPQIMTLLARAHERDGNRELMAEMLALAVEASGSAADEALRYAAHLIRDSKEHASEDILLDALRQDPDNLQLLAVLGSLYIELEDWDRATGVIDRLYQFDSDPASTTANELTARTLAAQGSQNELLGFLDGLSQEDDGDIWVEVAIIRTHLSRGNQTAAQARLDKLLEKRPDDPMLRFVQAALQASAGQTENADATFRALLEGSPQSERIWTALYRLHLSVGDVDKAMRVLDEALVSLPDSAGLLWAKAEALRQVVGDIDGAIGIYETLYAQNSDSPVIANNLASLITTHRSDSESLERAYTIAKRLRDSDVPQFQDTYGWIAFRRGDIEAALAHLEPAAEALPNDPLVLYHLGSAYAAAGRDAEALAQLRAATELSPPAPLMDSINAEIARLSETDGTEAGTAERN